MTKKQKELNAIMNSAAEQLLEAGLHSVQIVGSFDNCNDPDVPVECQDDTTRFSSGAGSIFERLGCVQLWLNQENAYLDEEVKIDCRLQNTEHDHE